MMFLTRAKNRYFLPSQWEPRGNDLQHKNVGDSEDRGGGGNNDGLEEIKIST